MKRMRRYTREIRQSDSRIQSVIQESLQHRTVIKTLEQSDRHIGNWMICKMHSVVRYSVVPAFRSLHVCWWHLRFPAAILQHFFGGQYALAQGVSPSEQ